MLTIFCYSYLTTYDCVSFYSFIETVIAANTAHDGKQIKQSQWLLHEAGNRAIAVSRELQVICPPLCWLYVI